MADCIRRLYCILDRVDFSSDMGGLGGRNMKTVQRKPVATIYLGRCPICGVKAKMRLRKRDGEIYTQAYCTNCGREGPIAASYSFAAKMFGSAVYKLSGGRE